MDTVESLSLRIAALEKSVERINSILDALAGDLQTVKEQVVTESDTTPETTLERATNSEDERRMIKTLKTQLVDVDGIPVNFAAIIESSFGKWLTRNKESLTAAMNRSGWDERRIRAFFYCSDKLHDMQATMSKHRADGELERRGWTVSHKHEKKEGIQR